MPGTRRFVIIIAQQDQKNIYKSLLLLSSKTIGYIPTLKSQSWIWTFWRSFNTFVQGSVPFNLIWFENYVKLPCVCSFSCQFTVLQKSRQYFFHHGLNLQFFLLVESRFLVKYLCLSSLHPKSDGAKSLNHNDLAPKINRSFLQNTLWF